ncbi:Fic family protein [Bacillus norwichensis]|uniref:Fic family protein n=1 Tax=Bacillus norwichensis TaxID=2762217 RepID=A0ABR8VKZ2_9BACI|nr:Fic family protein [Bacillus norwichensis]MBD8005424.1 Fic family protein [Bacillus norwichensis]
MFEEIDQKKRLLDNKRPLPVSTLKTLREKLLLEWTYNSNAIEGNTLTLKETKVVLEGITVGGKTMREHLEIINHSAAILYVEEIVKKNEELSEWQIKNIHRLVLKGIDDENAGQYRKGQVFISGAEHIPPGHYLIDEKMEELIAWHNGPAQVLHPVEKAAMLHVFFVGIHPFIDGNGRTSRLLLNLDLMKDGYPPVVIKAKHRLAYYEALDKAHTKEMFDDFIELVKDELADTLDLYLESL